MSSGVYISGKRWTPDEERKLRELFAAGWKDREIAEAFPGRFGERAITHKRSRMGLVDKTLSNTSRAVKERLRRERGNALSAQQASIWHLIDLKRAGHSPTRTELKISPEGVGQRFAPEPSLTYRSPFAAIVEG